MTGAVYTQSMSEQEPDPPENRTSGKTPGEDPEKLPLGKTFRIMLVQTAVFAAVFFSIIWLVEGHSAIAAVLGIAAIAYLLAKKFTG